jgi:hypothetical protein
MICRNGNTDHTVDVVRDELQDTLGVTAAISARHGGVLVIDPQTFRA